MPPPPGLVGGLPGIVPGGSFDPEAFAAANNSTTILNAFAQLQETIRRLETDRGRLMGQHDSIEQQVLLVREEIARKKTMEVAHATELLHGLEAEKMRVVELQRMKKDEKTNADARLEALETEKNDLIDRVVETQRQVSQLESMVAEEKSLYAAAESEKTMLWEQFQEMQARLLQDQQEAARKIRLLEDKHLELSKVQAVQDAENRKLMQQVTEEKALMETEQANERKAGALLNNVLRLNEKLVQQLQQVGKSRKGPWRPTSAMPNHVESPPPPVPKSSVHSMRSGGGSTARSKSASRRRSSSVSRLTAPTASTTSYKNANLPRSHAQVRSVEQREAAHERRQVDKLEADFHRLDQEFRTLLDGGALDIAPRGADELSTGVPQAEADTTAYGANEDAWLQTVLDSMHQELDREPDRVPERTMMMSTFA